MQCSNNLKQIGLAIHNYHDTYNAVPPLRDYNSVALPVSSWNSQNYSWRARILPFMEQTALYEQINFEQHHWWGSANRPNPMWDIVNPTVVAGFRCPSEPGTGVSNWTDPTGVRRNGTPSNVDWAPANYFASVGPDVTAKWNGSGLGFMDGIQTTSSTRAKFRKFRDITDGLSNTLAVSEGVIGHPRQSFDATGYTGSRYSLTTGTAGNLAATADNNGCPPNGTQDGNTTNARGNSWLWGYSPNQHSFTTLMAPNSKLWDCSVNSASAMYAARSLHTGGVQSLRADGSVSFTTDSVDFLSWRAFGGISDGVIVNID